MARSRFPAVRLVMLTLVAASSITLRAPADTQSGGTAVNESKPAPKASGLPTALTDAVVPVVNTVTAPVSALRPQAWAPVRLLVISSGVDRGVFPAGIREHLRVVGDAGDAAGYGTYAVSALYQVLGAADVTVYNVYSGRAFQAGKQSNAFTYASANASRFDAVLYAVPPSEFLDPVTLLMATPAPGGTQWGELLTAIGDNPLPAARGRAAAFGVAMDPAARHRQLAGASSTQRVALGFWADAAARWQAARAQVQELAAKGLPVVAPAGDLGPSFQTIFGIANLSEVIAVGATSDGGVARTSSSGPSMDMRAKPDLVAPGNLVGALPKASLLSEKLPIDDTLRLVFPGGAEATGGNRVRVDSTVPAAAVIAAQVAALHAAGVTDARMLRGALVAAASPLRGVPVWRQGAGAFTRPVTATYVRSRGIALAPGDLGAEPAAGAWQASVPFANRAPLAARTRITDFAGVGANTKGSFRTLDAPDVVRASAGNGGVTITTGMGERWDAGLYCGYTTVSVPGSSSDVSPTVSGDGMPAGLREQVPTCLLNGSRLVLHGFYIHDQPAENLTFALIPDLPERETVMSGVPKHLPVDTFSSRLYQKVTGADGNAVLTNVPPGYYRIRQFSDYGAPVTFDATGADGNAIATPQELGENPSYQDVPAYVLSAFNLTEADLKATFGAGNVAYEKPTGGYLVTIGPKQVRIILNWMKKMPGPAVTSRYVDLIERDDLTYTTAPVPPVLARMADPAVAARSAWPLAADGWLVEGVNAPALHTGSDDISAQYNGVRSASDTRLGGDLGVAQYTFALTQPNYLTRMSINFEYTLQNAAVVVCAKIGLEVECGAVADTGVMRFATDSQRIVPQINLAPAGTTGTASFDLEIHSHNLPEGTLTFLFVPAETVAKEAAPLAAVEMRSPSMRVSTWQRTLWPATMTPQGMGHAFDVSPNVSRTQMSHEGCRHKQVQGYSYDECEDWVVLVHTPAEDAALTAVRRNGVDESAAIGARGGRYFDPRRGITDFSDEITHTQTLGSLDANLSIANAFRSNGRFWEQLAIPLAYLRDAPGTLRLEIVDNLRGRDSALFGHTLGPAPVVPYIPYGLERTPAALTQTVVVPTGVTTTSVVAFICDLV